MRRVLIISYYWPPAGGPGSLRVLKVARYLSKYGIQPVVLTVRNGEFPYLDPSLKPPEDVPVYRAWSADPFALYKFFTRKNKSELLPVGLLTRQGLSRSERLAAFIRSHFFIPDARVGWVLCAFFAALKILKKENIDVLFISSPPHSSQLVGVLLNRATRLRWAADLRDPWTDIRYYQFVKRNRLANAIDLALERAVLASADHILTVSRPLARTFQARVKRRRLNITVLPNGYDDEDFPRPSKAAGRNFIILHTGNLQDHQNPAVLWHSLKKLAAEYADFRKKAQVLFIGTVAASVLRAAEEEGLAELLHVRSFVPHEQAVKEMIKASILLVVVPQVENNAGIVTGKLFEYIGSGRPVLVIGPPAGEAGLVAAKISNSLACDYGHTSVCVKFLRENYLHWAAKRTVLSRPAERLPYSRAQQVQKIAGILQRL